MQRRIAFAAVFLLLISALVVAGAGTTGNTSWAGNYRVMQFPAQHVMSVTVTWSGTTTGATIYCGVQANNPNYTNPMNPAASAAWIPEWGVSSGTGTQTYGVMCDTTAVLVRTNAQAAPSDMNISPPPGGVSSTPTATAIPATSTPLPATATPTSISTSTSPAPTTSPPPSTNTPIPPTATTSVPTPTASATMPPMEGMADGGNTCGNLSEDPNAVDQNGVPLWKWAPGLRIGCGFAGFENGDNPMPAGTHLPVPRPFDFDRAVVAHESAFGFKVYYRKGSEAPSGYQGTGGCGDVRVILHQGGSVHGFTTQYHTVQIAMDKCDAQGNHHILDIAGRINTGILDQRQNPDSQRAEVDRLTATTLSCDGRTQFSCATVWYSAFDYQVPGGGWNAWHHFGFLVENPITLYDPACPNCIHLTGNDGTTTMLRDHQYSVPPRSNVADWWAMFDTDSGVNVLATQATPGAWAMHIDPWFNDQTVLEPASGTDHPHPTNGVVYPN